MIILPASRACILQSSCSPSSPSGQARSALAMGSPGGGTTTYMVARLAVSVHSPSLATGVGGRAPPGVCWPVREVPGRALPPAPWWWWWRCLACCCCCCSNALAGWGTRAWRGLVVGEPSCCCCCDGPRWGAWVLRRSSISLMRASRASSSVACELICCFLCRGGALPGERRRGQRGRADGVGGQLRRD